jgi:hypothetical protein
VSRRHRPSILAEWSCPPSCSAAWSAARRYPCRTSGASGETPAACSSAGIPLWFILAAAALCPSVRLWGYLRQHQRRGGCPACGYDLRATPERCPECGTIPGVTNRAKKPAGGWPKAGT